MLLWHTRSMLTILYAKVFRCRFRKSNSISINWLANQCSTQVVNSQ